MENTLTLGLGTLVLGSYIYSKYISIKNEESHQTILKRLEDVENKASSQFVEYQVIHKLLEKIDAQQLNISRVQFELVALLNGEKISRSKIAHG